MRACHNQLVHLLPSAHGPLASMSCPTRCFPTFHIFESLLNVRNCGSSWLLLLEIAVNYSQILHCCNESFIILSILYKFYSILLALLLILSRIAK